jgi:K+-transporting ATPase ATPase A chain
MSQTAITVTEFAVFMLVIVLLVRPVGTYLLRVFEPGGRTWLDPMMRPAERAIYRICRVDPTHEMGWGEYALAFVLFGIAGTAVLFLMLLLQPLVAWNNGPYLTSHITPDLALNAAVSFVTTTTWTPYAGETTMSYISQIVGLSAASFMAGATGLALAMAFIRGLARQRLEGEPTVGLGNFWVDVIRGLLWVILPVSVVGALFLVSQGVPLTLGPYVLAHTLQGGTQVIARGPVAAMEWIQNMGTNGGGFFNANNAHPFQDPTALANFVELLSIIVVPAALTHTFGRMVGRTREGWMLFSVMSLLFVAGLVGCYWAEQSGNPVTSGPAHYSTVATATQPGGNMEGKEVRFGIGESVLNTVTTSNTATGITNSMPDSYTPLGGLVPMVNMLLGEIIFGGLGSGLYSIIVVAIVGLFMAGLMIGRTPEYLGKKIQPRHMKVIALFTLALPMTILLLTAAGTATNAGRAGLTTNTGPHGLSEILYAYTSTFDNNGQSFGGLSGNSPFYNVTTVIAMLIGRYGLGILALWLAGTFAQQRRRLPTMGTLRTDTAMFGTVIIATAGLVGALTFFAVICLGPLVEQLST